MGECETNTSEDDSDCTISWETLSYIKLQDLDKRDSDHDSHGEGHDSDTESSATGRSLGPLFDVMRDVKHRALQTLLDSPRLVVSAVTRKDDRATEPLCRFGNTVFRDDLIVTKRKEPKVGSCNIYPVTSVMDESNNVLQEVAQVVFFFRGSLQKDALPMCIEHPPVFYDRDCTERDDCSDSAIVAYVLAGLESEFMAHIWRACINWLCTAILIGDLPDAEAMALQDDRMSYWDAELSNTDLGAIFAVLKPGVDVERVLEEKGWEKWARIMAIQLVDDLYVFHFAQPPSPLLDSHIIGRYRAASMRAALEEILDVHIEEIPVGGALKSLLLSL